MSARLFRALLLAVCAVTFAACSSGEVDPEPEPPTLGEWEEALRVPETEFYGIERVGATGVWVVGRTRCGAGSGCGGWQIVVYVSDDLGATWRHTALGATRDRIATAVYPLDAERAVFLTPNALFGTTDGGRTWTETQAVGTNYLLDFASPSAGGPWAGGTAPAAGGGTNAILFRSPDGGRTWGPVEGSRATDTRSFLSVSNPTPTAVYAVGSDDGIVGGGRLTRSLDGGQTWQRLLIPPNLPGAPSLTYRAVAFASATTGWVGGEFENIYRTTDGGVTWAPQFIDSFEDDATFVTQIRTRSEREALLVFGNGSGATYATADGGQTWTYIRYRAIPVTGVYRIAYGTAGPAFGISVPGVIYRTTGS